MATQERALLHPPRDRPAPEAGRGRRAHRRAVQDYGYIQARVESSDVHGRSGEGEGDHPHRRRGGAAVPGRRRRLTGTTVLPVEEIKRAQARSRPATCSRAASCATAPRASPTSTAPSAGPRPTSIPRIVQDNANRTINITFEIERGPRGLRRADQHHRQHPQRGEDPPPGDPDRGGRPLHAARSCSGRASGWSTWATSRRSTSRPQPGTDKTRSS